MTFRNIPLPVEEWLIGNGSGMVTDGKPVGGGCINHGQQLITQSGQTFFLKTNTNCPADMFAREAAGLKALAIAGGPRVPEPILWGSKFLLMEDLRPTGPQVGYWEHFGWQLATVHLQTGDRFGFENDNYLGSTPQPNGWMSDGFDFFGERRLLFQAELAARHGRLSRNDVGRVERVAKQLRERVPEQPASLLHGDLWSGNAVTDEKGAPAMIDPATHYGWAEAELGMTQLFGAFPEVFYRAYSEVRPLATGWRERLGIYNLYHLLNHLNLFGAGYLGAVQAMLHQLVG
jgi:fructosamine-3-kinase